MLERRDAGKEGYRKVGIQGRWDAGRGMLNRCDAGKEGCRKGGMQEGNTK